MYILFCICSVHQNYAVFTHTCNIKNVINTNCLSIKDPLLLNKKDSQGVISNIKSKENTVF